MAKYHKVNVSKNVKNELILLDQLLKKYVEEYPSELERDSNLDLKDIFSDNYSYNEKISKLIILKKYLLNLGYIELVAKLPKNQSIYRASIKGIFFYGEGGFLHDYKLKKLQAEKNKKLLNAQNSFYFASIWKTLISLGSLIISLIALFKSCN